MPANPRPRGRPLAYSYAKRTEAVTMFMTLGSLLMVSGATGIPITTLKNWRAQDWWKEITDELQASEKIVLSAKLQKIINRSLEITENRLDEGDFFYDQKLGELVRKPVSLRDAAAVAQMALTQKTNIQTVEQVATAQEGVMDKLQKLSDSLAQFAKAKPAVNVTDVVFIEEVKE